ncbi:MAG: DUF6985 domain-containing protein [Corynebacterium sp.]|jgi:hypothetical protein|uniref:DUF6985 domain-containing protein n=1 Tax=unclassified Corynebacterium TaxID=2624378 RepID=UPI0009673F16|nr:hypothetical protein [Corynebacterium sp. CNJ-954]OLT50081.1 hypothetical protein BJF89_11760 [Corynebacterium sp. CNJ-954]
MTIEIPGHGQFSDSDDEWTATLSVDVVGDDVEFTVIHDDEDVDLDDVATCLSNYRSLPESALKGSTPEVFANYREMAEEFSAEERADYGIPEIADPDDVWNFVTLGTSATVELDDETDEWFVITENECEWEPEHGLQLVLRNGEEVTRVSQYDGFIRE